MARRGAADRGEYRQAAGAIEPAQDVGLTLNCEAGFFQFPIAAHAS
jgi:hypothetical protein